MTVLKIISSAVFISTLILPITTQAGHSYSININKASAYELYKTLVFVNESTARRIVEYRQQHGQFNSIENLALVEGVSKRLARYNQHRISF